MFVISPTEVACKRPWQFYTRWWRCWCFHFKGLVGLPTPHILSFDSPVEIKRFKAVTYVHEMKGAGRSKKRGTWSWQFEQEKCLQSPEHCFQTWLLKGAFGDADQFWPMQCPVTNIVIRRHWRYLRLFNLKMKRRAVLPCNSKIELIDWVTKKT